MELKTKLKSLFFTTLLLFVPESTWALETFELIKDFTQSFSFQQKVFTNGTKISGDLFEITTSFREDSWNVSNKITTEKLTPNFPIIFSGGNISASGILSKITNPEIDSSVSGLSSAYSEPSGITSSLGSFSSFTNPLRTFMEFSYINEKFPIKNAFVNGIYTPSEGTHSYSTKLIYQPQDFLTVTATGGINFYKLQENSSSSWYLKEPYFPSEKTFALALQTSFNAYCFYSNFSLFSYKTHTDNIENIYKTDHKIELENIKFSATGYFNYNLNIISPDNVKLKPCTQIKVNFQYLFPLKSKNEETGTNSIKLGLTSYSKICATEKNHDLKTGFTNILKLGITSLQLEGKFSFTIKTQEKKLELNYISFNFNNTWDLDFISPWLTMSGQYYISSGYKNVTQNYKINTGVFLWKDFLTAQGGFSYGCKNHIFYNKKLDFGLNCAFNYKKINFILKISGEFCI